MKELWYLLGRHLKFDSPTSASDMPIFGIIRVLPSIALVFSQSLLLLGAPLEYLVGKPPSEPSIEFKQYSRYVTLDETKGTNFYYFVVAEVLPPTYAPYSLVCIEVRPKEYEPRHCSEDVPASKFYIP